MVEVDYEKIALKCASRVLSDNRFWDALVERIADKVVEKMRMTDDEKIKKHCEPKLYFKGCVETRKDLDAKTDAKWWDVWNVKDENMNYVRLNDKWIDAETFKREYFRVDGI